MTCLYNVAITTATTTTTLWDVYTLQRTPINRPVYYNSSNNYQDQISHKATDNSRPKRIEETLWLKTVHPTRDNILLDETASSLLLYAVRKRQRMTQSKSKETKSRAYIYIRHGDIIRRHPSLWAAGYINARTNFVFLFFPALVAYGPAKKKVFLS